MPSARAARAEAKPEKRECSKLIRFTAAELQIVVDRARGCGRPVACYIREVSLGGKPRIAAASLAPTMIRDLARVATHLQRLRSVANERALPETESFGAAVDDVMNLIRALP